jgi:hypothetical protein
LKTNLACVLQIAKLKTTKQMGKGCWLSLMFCFVVHIHQLVILKKKSEK